MPKQNRVTPTGEIIATAARGTLLGNRGCLHDEHQQIRRPYQLQRWIICLLEFKGRRHIIMTPGHYTELFFLDEATALAAGHRPCAECQRGRFNEFRAIWARANADLAGSTKPLATIIDAVLHRERLDANGRKITYSDRLSALPDGSFIQQSGDDTAWLVLGDQLLAWSAFGYTQRIARSAGETRVAVLTPRSIVRALTAGYEAGIHPSALQSKP
ncbi:MAG: hypothetical protein HY870_24505 [Chloroflexi bacterium]|nr:hypothetical protein [Chloroflexota bacterium]